MLQIVLIRPGTTDYDQQERILGNLDVPLNEQGAAESLQLVEPLREKDIDALCAAETRPAKQTAEILAKGLGLRLRCHDAWENLNLGLWQGMPVADVRHKQPRVYRQWQEQPETVCPPDGETLAEAEERVRQGLAKLLRRRREGVVALVLSEPLLSVVRRVLTQSDALDLWHPTLAPGQWEAIKIEPALVLAASD